jgi:hypothetical protein
VTDLDDFYGPMEVDDDFDTALGTKTLTGRDIVPPGFDSTAADTLGYSFYTCNVRGVRESLQQCKEADHTGEKCPGR